MIYPHKLNKVFGSKSQGYPAQQTEEGWRLQQPKCEHNKKKKKKNAGPVWIATHEHSNFFINFKKIFLIWRICFQKLMYIIKRKMPHKRKKKKIVDSPFS